MQISVSDAKARLTELVRRAEEGEDIVLTRHGQPVARLAPIVAAQNCKVRLALLLALLEEMRQEARTKAATGPGAARQGFVYDTGEWRLYPL